MLRSSRSLNALSAFLLVLALVGCGKKSDVQTESRPSASPVAPVKASHVARDASMTVEAKDISSAVNHISTEAKNYGGSVDHSSITNSDEHYGNLTVRVPADTLDAFLRAIHRLGFDIPEEEVTAQDVTESYSSEQSELATKKATLERLKMLESRQKTVTEEIELQKQLAELQAEVDRLQNGSANVTSTVRFSRVTFWVRQPKPGFFEGIGLGLSHGFSSVSDVLQVVITIAIAGIPAFLLLFLIILIFRKLLRRFDRGAKATS